MKKITDFVINKPKKIILIALLLLIPTLIGFVFTPVNYDILTYLPKNLDSVKGEEILTDTFNMSSMTMVIVEDMKSKDVVKLKNSISQVEHVSNVIWSDDILDISVPADILPDEIKNIFYSSDSTDTMLFVQFEPDCSSRQAMDSVRKIRNVTAGQCMLSGLTPISVDTNELTNKELPIYIILAVALALIVMFATMESFLLPVVLVGVLFIAVIYNMGTNFVLGSVSYITQCIAAILQLGVTMDYSIFLVNRYTEEKKRASTKEEAMRRALNASAVSLKGSSMTTIFGFLALCFMQLTLGFNIGIVMAKGVIIGVASVIIILPAFLLLLDKRIFAKSHKVFSPDFKKPIKFALKSRKIFRAVFIILLVPAVLLAANVKKYYNLTSTLPKNFESVQALESQKNNFGMTSSHFIIVDDSISGEKLVEMETKLQNVKGIKSMVAYNLYAGSSVPDSILPDDITAVIKQGGYQLMLATSVYEAATDESNAQVEEMTKIIKEYDSKGYITGEGAMYNDLVGVTKVDFAVTSIISIAAIFILIAVIFKSVSIPVILIASIELAIFINEAISTVFGTTIPFVAPTIISCVQLGATVDYAILLTSRFKEELAKGRKKSKAIIKAASESMKSIFQSASIFFAATFGVYLVSSIEIVKEICAMLARGSVISALVILFFLTPILYLSEGLISKTTKNLVPSDTGNDAEVISVNTEENKIEETSFDGDYSFTQFTFTDDEN